MPMRTLIATIVCSALLSGFSLNAEPQDAASAPNEEALGGLDPVRLVQGQEVDGKDDLAVTWRGLVYYFATAETKAAFQKDPTHYAVQLDGFCARMGPPVSGAQALHAVHAGRIYVFGSEECHRRFVADATRYLDTTPSPVAGLSPAQVTRGRALLDRTVTAHGGAAALSAIRGFRERTRQDLTTMRGPSTTTVETTAVLPDRWRQETVNQYGQFLLVLTPDAAFRASARSTPRPLSDPLRDYYTGAFRGHILALLRAHLAGTLQAGSLDPITVGGATLERVAVGHDGEAVVVALDPSGRIRSLTTRGHSPREGDIVTILRTFADYRAAGALTLPFRVDATIDGVASPDLSYAIESIEIDPGIDAASLTKPLEARP
jgi:YHS domain-containing protein